MRTNHIARCIGLSLLAASCSNPPDAGSGNPSSGSQTGTSATTTQGSSTSQTSGGSQTTGGDQGTGGASSTSTTQSTTTSGSGGAATGGSAGTSGSGGSQATGGNATGGAGGTGGSGTGGSAGANDGGTGCLPGVIGHPDCSQPAPPAYAGFTLYLDEEFSTPLDLSTDPIWTYSDGGQPEGDQRFVKDAITFTGGNMVITATARNIAPSKSCSEFLPNVPNSSSIPNKTHASGEFRSKYNNFRYGRYETSFESPQGQPAGAGGCVEGMNTANLCSNFLTTFFIFRTPKSKGPNGGGQWREIDIEIEGDHPSSLGTNLVTQDNNPNGGYDSSRAEVVFAYPAGGNGAMGLPPGFNVRQAGFHTYAFEWTPQSIKWFVDGVLVRVKMAGSGLPIPAESAHIMANLWFFPSNAAFGNPALNTYPMTSKYNYIRFYKWNQDTTYPKANPATELPAGDLGTRNNSDDGMGPCQ